MAPPPGQATGHPSGRDTSERFTIRGRLGAGGLGVVYRAFDRQRGTEVALKTLREVTGADLYRFKREFRSLADLHHPNLVTLHELHTVGGEWMLTMELVEGEPFIDRVRLADPDEVTEDATGPGRDEDEAHAACTGTAPTVGGALPGWTSRARERLIRAELCLERLEPALYQLVDTVHALHQAGKLHRDLKPSNVLVEPGGRLVVLDFGLVAEVNPAAPELTHTTSAVGTPAYMSPEQAADAPLTPASDWYSVGVMLYEALTGRRPIDVVGPDVDSLRWLPPPRSLDAAVPARLDALCLRLLAVDPAARPSGEEILAALGREPSRASRALVRELTSPPFVGRADELGVLRAALDEVSAGHGVAVFLRGASGMGKSLLLRKFLEDAALVRGTVVLKGQCYPRESVPFKTLDAVVDALTTYLMQRAPAELAALVPREATALARLFPVLLRVPAIADPPMRTFLPPDPVELRRRAFGALRELLARMSTRHPVVLAVDDVQWGDADSGNFFAELLLHPDAPAILLVFSHRSEDEDVTPLLAALRRSRAALGGAPVPVPVREITLGPLAEPEARQLLGSVRPGSSRWVDEVIREAGGNPLFVSELARASAPGGEEPLALEQVLVGRIARLDDTTRQILCACALAGRPLPSSIALQAAGLSGEGSHLATLAGERLLRVRPGSAGPELETYHDRIRAAAIAGLSPDERRRLHAALARALQLGATRDREALVEHWLEAGEPARAATHAALAAGEAEARLAFHRAADLYAIAIDHGEHGETERRALSVKLGQALAHAGRLDESAATFARAAEGTQGLERLELARLELEQLLRGGKLQLGLEKARVVLAGVGHALPRSTLGALASLLAQRLGIRFRRLERREVTPAASPPEPERVRRAEVLYSVASGLGFVSPILGQVLQMRYLREALASRHPRHLGLALSAEMGYLGIRGTRHRAAILALEARARALAARTGDRQLLGVVRGMAGFGAFMCGAWREAAAEIHEGASVLRDEATGVRWLLDVFEHFQLSALWYLGELRQLAHLVPILLRTAEEDGNAFAQRMLRGWRGNLYWLLLDQPEEARRQALAAALARAPGQPAQLTHYYELLAHGQRELYQGDAAAAHARVEAIWRDLDRALLFRIEICHVEAWYLRARAALALARTAASPAARAGYLALATRAARRIERQGAPWGLPIAALLRATVAHVEGGPAEAVSGLLGRALAGFEVNGMQLYAAVVRRRLGECLGASAGAEARAASAAYLAAQGVQDPEAMTSMLAPGWS